MDTSNMTARELFETRRRYSLLHHKNRLKHFASKPKLSAHDITLQRQSERVIAHPCEGDMSVSLDDDDYLKELDEFKESLA